MMEKLKCFGKHVLSQIPIVLVILDLHFGGKYFEGLYTMKFYW